MIQNLSSLIPGMYGILEPGSEQKGTLERELTDLVLVPGAAFSRDFMRMGRGGGYYDRYLSEYFGIRVGVAREYMLFDKIPSEGHDQKVDILITEKKIYR